MGDPPPGIGKAELRERELAAAAKLKEYIVDSAKANPEIAEMATAYQLLRLPQFRWMRIKSLLGAAPSYTQMAEALRAAQAELNKPKPTPRRRLIIEEE